MSTYRTEGIVLRRSDFGEANLLLHIYTKEFGKIEAVGRSARKPQGKLKGLLEPFLYSDFMFVRGKKMDTVANSFVLESYLPLRGDFESVLAASAVTEIANRMTMTGYRDERVFRLILESLRFINEGTGEERRGAAILILFFEINLLALSGFSPCVSRCAFCGEKIRTGENYFSNSLGGVLDAACGKKCPDAARLDDNMVRLLKFLQVEGEEAEGYGEDIREKLVQIRKLKVERGVLTRSILLMKSFIEFNLDQKINSLDLFCNFARGKN